IRNAPNCDGSFEASRVTDDPVRHESAVAPAGNAETLGIDPGILRQNSVDAVHDVSVWLVSPVQLHTAIKLLAVAGGPAWVGKENGPPMSGIPLKLVEPVEARHSGRAAMNAEYHRILFARFPSDRFHQKSINIPSIGALERHALH